MNILETNINAVTIQDVERFIDDSDFFPNNEERNAGFTVLQQRLMRPYKYIVVGPDGSVWSGGSDRNRQEYLRDTLNAAYCEGFFACRHGITKVDDATGGVEGGGLQSTVSEDGDETCQ